tara:strand:+ start:97 stop:327 length:231 start_codon:yes stop_codon:yes gene_type:complete
MKEKAVENYKVECVAHTGISYLQHPFEVFFEKEEAMYDFMDIVPDSYSTKHFQRDTETGEWDLIATIPGWRRDCCN